MGPRTSFLTENIFTHSQQRQTRARLCPKIHRYAALCTCQVIWKFPAESWGEQPSSFFSPAAREIWTVLESGVPETTDVRVRVAFTPLAVLLLVMKNAVPPLAHAPCDAIEISATASANTVGVITRQSNNRAMMDRNLNVCTLLITCSSLSQIHLARKPRRPRNNSRRPLYLPGLMALAKSVPILRIGG